MSVVIVTYRPDSWLLQECLTSVAKQSYRPLELIVVDNGSPQNDLTAAISHCRDLVRDDDQLEISLKQMGYNSGFAVATNAGLAATSGPLCLLLNPDAVLAADAIQALVTSSEVNPQAIGFAPKVRLHAHPDIIDSVGIAFAWTGDAFQRGLGEPDIGQFDSPEHVPGVTMGATLIRRDAFLLDRVGPIDERFFMFMEDVDWSMRAALQGEHFISVPSAVVWHVGSQTVRRQSFGWRYRLIERNVYFVAIKNYERRHLTGFLIRRTRAHRRNLTQGRLPGPTLRVLIAGFGGLWRFRNDRRRLQGRRRLPDKALLVTPPPKVVTMDYPTWSPVHSWAVLQVSVGRLFAVTGEERWGRALRYLEAVVTYDVPEVVEDVLETLEAEVGGLPDALVGYAKRIPSIHQRVSGRP